LTDQDTFERTLTIVVTEAEIDSAKEHAAHRLGQGVSIKGFRPGKAPRKLIEAAIGSEKLRREAIDDILPDRVNELLTEQELRPALTPRLAALRDVPAGVEADVTVTLWPELAELPDYRGRHFTVPDPVLTEDDVAQQIERMREQFAHLEPVERTAEQGDVLALDISADSEGRPLEPLTTRDLLYELGSGALVNDADHYLVGLSAGESVFFPSVVPEGFGELAGTNAEFSILVNEVKVKVLPEFTDEWVADVTEFDTVEELRDSLTVRMAGIKNRQVKELFRQLVLATLITEMSIDLPDALISAEMENIFHRFMHRLETEDVGLDDYLSLTEQDRESFLEDVAAQAVEALRTRLLLDRIGQEEGVELVPGELDRVVENLASASSDPERFRTGLSQGAPLLSLAGDILRQKALDAVVAAAVPVDSDGNRIVFESDEVEVDAVAEVVAIAESEVEAEVIPEVANED